MSDNCVCNCMGCVGSQDGSPEGADVRSGAEHQHARPWPGVRSGNIFRDPAKVLAASRGFPSIKQVYTAAEKRWLAARHILTKESVDGDMKEE